MTGKNVPGLHLHGDMVTGRKAREEMAQIIWSNGKQSHHIFITQFYTSRILCEADQNTSNSTQKPTLFKEIVSIEYRLSK